MATVVPEKKGNQTYYFLRHSSGTDQLKRYLGKTIPKNIGELKKEFLLEFYQQQWQPKLQAIYDNYQKETQSLPEKIKLQNFESLGITFTYNTQRIEGSSLTQEDTKDLLIHGITPNKKSKIDTIETQRHHDLFVNLTSSDKLTKITLDTVLSWHKNAFEQTQIGEAGSVRTYAVGIKGNPKIEFATVPEIKPRLAKLFKWINNVKDISPVEIACKAHYDFVVIHPFGDGNGRISRLLMNYILFKHDYPLMIIFNKNRKPYFKSLERSQLNDEPIHFQKWFMKNYFKENAKYL